jgi:hypothetical protein
MTVPLHGLDWLDGLFQQTLARAACAKVIPYPAAWYHKRARLRQIAYKR